MEEDEPGEKTSHDPNQSHLLPKDSTPTPSHKVYKRRWLMLFLFCIFSLSSAFQWIHLNIIGNIVLNYYNESLPGDSLQQESAVDWLSLSYMIVYLPCIIPCMLFLNTKGLRWNNIVGSFMNAAGAWIKVAAIGPHLFPLLMGGQFLCAVAEVFVVSIPPRIAAVWFGPNEVSTATSVGVFGNQIGVAVGFLVPPLLVSNSPDLSEISSGLQVMCYSTAGITTLIFLLMIIVYREEPPLPPSQAQLLAKHSTSERNYRASLYNLMTNPSFVLLAISYGILTGAFYAISTLLNSFILAYFPGSETAAGQIGLTIVFTGIAGAVLAGIWLDKTKTYKSTSVIIYALSFLGMIAFTVILHCDVGLIWLIFLVCGILGFFMTGYLPVGYEFAAEITYPECEATSSGILTASAMMFGLILTLGMRAVMNKVSILAANIILCAFVFVGVILTALVKPDYRRQKAEKQILDKYDHLEITVNPPTNEKSREVTYGSSSDKTDDKT